MLQASSDTTTYGTSNAAYLLLRHPDLAEELRTGGNDKTGDFVEEVLRLHGPAHLRSREALKETSIAGQNLCPRDPVIPIIAAANRDPKHYVSPAHIDLNRKQPRDHLAFHYGTHSCVGASLARAELREAVSALLQRLPDMKLDSSKPQPAMTGWLLRSYHPLHVVFEPKSAA